MSLYNKYNNENIIVRAAIAGMLDILNNNLKYNQVWDNDNEEEINVPWYYNKSGDERFMQDFYTHYAECNFPRPIDGNYDKIPRGVITYSGSRIDSNRLTNRFIQGKYVKEVNGKLQSYISFLYSIPLTINFDCEVWIDTQLSALKIEQVIRETFFKTTTFYVYYKGMRLGCTAGFPDESNIDKLIKYSFEEDNRIKLTFKIETETYQPVFDPTTEMDANNYMSGIGYKLYVDNDKNNGVIKIKSPKSNIIMPKNNPLLVEWTTTKEVAVVNSLDSYWAPVGTNNLFKIETGISNHGYWFWNIPKTFSTYVHPVLIWDDSSDIKIYREPNISIIPNLLTNIIDVSSFIIINGGYFMTPTSDTSIGVQLEMRNDEGKVSYTNDNDIFINIENYKIKSSDPVWVNPNSSIIFPGTLNPKTIDLYLKNTVDHKVFDVINNITIV